MKATTPLPFLPVSPLEYKRQQGRGRDGEKKNAPCTFLLPIYTV